MFELKGTTFCLPAGESHSVAGTTMSYTLAADVALLTRNIKIIGQEYPKMMEESFGARLLVGTYSWAGIDYKGLIKIIASFILNIVFVNLLFVFKCCIFQHTLCLYMLMFVFPKKTGQAHISNVEFYHSGQEGWIDSSDPRYSVAFLNLGEVRH